MSSFGDRLREVRKLSGLSQTAFGTLGAVSPETQLNYEKGTRKPDSAYLAALASQGMDVLYILTGERIPRGAGALSEAEAALLARYRSGSAVLRGYLQEVGQGPCSGGNTVTIGGDVGQQVAGDQSVTAPMKFNVGSKRK